MKKYINMGVTALVAVLTFVFNAFAMATSAFGGPSGYEAIMFDQGKRLTLFAIASIVLMVVAIAIIIFVVLEFLKDKGIIKADINLAKITTILVCVAAVVALGALIANILVVNAFGMGIGACTILAVIAYAALVALRFVLKDKE